MTLQQARGILHEMLHQIPPSLGREDKQAVLMGKAAIEKIQHYRAVGAMATNWDLPGETKK